LNHYVYYPLTGWLDEDVFQISKRWTFISPGRNLKKKYVHDLKKIKQVYERNNKNIITTLNKPTISRSFTNLKCLRPVELTPFKSNNQSWFLQSGMLSSCFSFSFFKQIWPRTLTFWWLWLRQSFLTANQSSKEELEFSFLRYFCHF
jgi:hypothetical protein